MIMLNRSSRSVIVDATICERQDQADKRKSRLVTAQVLRTLNTSQAWLSERESKRHQPLAEAVREGLVE